MARDPKRLRKNYEFKIGKDLTDKLSDEQISLLSKYYNSLSIDEQRDIDNKIFKGMTNDLFEMAYSFIEEKKAPVATGVIDDEDDDFEPLGLEELLQDIGEESKREKALAIYEGARDDDLVTEEIDERVLEILGLEDLIGFTYGEYKQILFTELQKINKGEEVPTDRAMLLQDEFKRIKGRVGKFVIKKKKVTVDDVGVAIKPRKLLKPAEIIKGDTEEAKVTEEKGKKKDIIAKYLSEIIPIVKSIRKLLSEQNDIAKNVRETETRRLEKERRSRKESQMEQKEKSSKFLKNLKSAAPNLGIFDAIKRFITNVLLGKAIIGLLDWMSDSDNNKKLNILGQFLKDWWPALLGAFVAFATPMGIFIRGFVGILTKLTAFILTKAIPKLLMFAAKNPLIAGGLLAGGATLGAYLWDKKEEDKQVEREAKERNISQDVVKREIEEERNSLLGIIGDAFNNIGPMGFSGGGIAPKLGTDTIPAMLTPGEFVMSKPAVDKIGVDNLMGLNAAAGGTNQPSFIDGITYAAGGGPVGQSQGPKISPADYASLLGIASLEDDKAQGRADVAQALYNRLLAGSRYDRNYMQKSNSLKDIIIAPNQFEPTFGNPGDWANITDKKTAAIAVMNSSKGRKYGWSFEVAMNQINETEKALTNPVLQRKAQKHVGGRAYFLGTSQQGNMKAGDVLRGPSYNFFSHWYDEGSKYQKERGNIAAPVPSMLRPQPAQTKYTKSKISKPAGPKGLLESITDDQGLSRFIPKQIRNLIGPQSKISIPGPPEVGTQQMITLPPIVQSVSNPQPIPNMGASEPDFPSISAFGRNTRSKKLDTYGVIG